MDSAGSGHVPNPFNDAQQAQLRAQIIIYGSILREHLPEETLMSLCFADISQGSTVEDFHEDNLRRSTWEKIWEASSKRIREKPPPSSRLLQSGKKPGSATVRPSSKPTSASKPLKAPKSIAASRAATAKSKRVVPSNGLHLEEAKIEANEAASLADLSENHGKQAWDKINEEKCPEPSNAAVAKVECDAAVQANMVADPPREADASTDETHPSSKKTKTLDAAAEATALAETPEAVEAMAPSGLESLAEAGTEAYWKLSEDLKAGAGSASMHEEANILKGQEDDTKSNEGREGPWPDAEDEVKHMEKRRKTSPKSKEKPQDDESLRLKFVEGSHVEVVSDEEGLHGVWFSGKVLDVRNKKVHVIYDELLDEDGNERLEEWVLVYSTQGAVPRVRLAHPVSSSDLPLKHKVFSVGDHIDVWMNDGWWEGVVEGINSDNTNEITIFFPGEGDIGVADLRNLRPSLTWKDGKWVPWTREACKTDHSKTKESKKPKAERAVQKEETESLVLDGKRKREKPKRLEDELDDRASAKRTQQQEGKHVDTRSRRLQHEGRADASAKKTQPGSSNAADTPAKKTQQAASKAPSKKILKRKPEPEEKPRNVKSKKTPPSKTSSSSGKQGKDKKAKNTKAKKTKMTSLRNKGLK